MGFGKYILDLTLQSMDKLIEKLEDYSDDLVEKDKDITRILCTEVAAQAESDLKSVKYDGDQQVSVDAVPTSKGYKLVASGQSVEFREYGAGVTHYTGYPGTRPPNVAEIGQYGKGQGSRFNIPWVYYEDQSMGNVQGNKVFTKGNAPSAAMYNARKTMKARIKEVGKKVY
jgi:hypothetical protein